MDLDIVTPFHPLLCPVQSRQPPYEGGIHPVIQMGRRLRGIEQHGQWENIQQNPLRALDRHKKIVTGVFIFILFYYLQRLHTVVGYRQEFRGLANYRK